MTSYQVSMEASEGLTSSLNFRAPSNTSSNPISFNLPSVSFLSGPWYVTHSTLPMWRSSRNVVVTYTPLSSSVAQIAETPISDSSNLSETLIDDLVTYQKLSSDKQRTVKGVDTPHSTVQGAYTWRGKGWLKIASSQWEVLGWGEEDGGWVVTWFQKTLFTPMGIDIYARKKGGLSAGLLERIKAEMSKVGDDKFAKLTKDIFEIRHDRNE